MKTRAKKWNISGNKWSSDNFLNELRDKHREECGDGYAATEHILEAILLTIEEYGIDVTPGQYDMIYTWADQYAFEAQEDVFEKLGIDCAKPVHDYHLFIDGDNAAGLRLIEILSPTERVKLALRIWDLKKTGWVGTDTWRLMYETLDLTSPTSILKEHAVIDEKIHKQMSHHLACHAEA